MGYSYHLIMNGNGIHRLNKGKLLSIFRSFPRFPDDSQMIPIPFPIPVKKKKQNIPIGSMYGMYTNIWGILMVMLPSMAYIRILWDMDWENHPVILTTRDGLVELGSLGSLVPAPAWS